MEFVQIVDFETDRIDELRSLMKQFETDMPMSESTVVRSTFTSDRDHPNHFLALVEFRNYDEAMRNSRDARTGRWAEQMSALCTSEPKFINLDVLDRMPAAT
jgi:quinol monooxygenase YgiN